MTIFLELVLPTKQYIFAERPVSTNNPRKHALEVDVAARPICSFHKFTRENVHHYDGDIPIEDEC